ncbi:hypothetical protein ZWY2020_047964 [Hordeum vulgare]|nr:hypothetical protein ZWY2020_047964 [Hordeum vulgare]
MKKTRGAEKQAKKRKASSTEESTEAKRLKSLDENAPLDPLPLNIAPSYEMTPFENEEKEHLTNEEMKNDASEEHTDEEIRIDGTPQTFIPPEEPAQGSAEPEAPVDDIPQPEQAPQPEAQADEFPHPEEHAEENAHAPNPENALVVMNPETTMIVSPQGKKQNLQLMQHQPFSKRPKFQKESFFEERMYLIGENPYDKPHIRHLKFWTRTQLNYYASMLCGRNKIFQHRHIPHVELEEIPCFAPVLNVLHEAGLLPVCSDTCDWNINIVLQFYATLHISRDPRDINTWVLDWMTQHTHTSRLVPMSCCENFLCQFPQSRQ